MNVAATAKLVEPFFSTLTKPRIILVAVMLSSATQACTLIIHIIPYTLVAVNAGELIPDDGVYGIYTVASSLVVYCCHHI